MQQVAASVTAVWSDTEQSFIISGSSPVQRIPTKLYEYDSQGRLAAVLLPAVIDPLQSPTSSLRPKYEYAYNEQGHQTLIRDPLGHETRFTFDTQGRQQTRTLPLGFGTDGIASSSELSTLDTQPSTLAFTERMEYDNRGRMSLQISFEGIVTQYIYDDNFVNGFATGRMLEKRFFQDEAAYNNGNGAPSEVWSYNYDAFGRNVAITLRVMSPTGTVVEERNETNAYDLQGRLTQVANPEGILVYAYDNLGRKTATKV
jgi:YD repeat-containing protein